MLPERIDDEDVRVDFVGVAYWCCSPGLAHRLICLHEPGLFAVHLDCCFCFVYESGRHPGYLSGHLLGLRSRGRGSRSQH
jgi:hypothetical protein